jgi:hypothetical protein
MLPTNVPPVAPLKHSSYAHRVLVGKVDMTLIAGFPYHDGILLCADTEHSNDEMRTHGKKLRLIEGPSGKALLAYAGNLRYGTNAIQACEIALKRHGDLEETIRETLEREFVDKIRNVPSRLNDPDYWYTLIIAMHVNGSDEARLYCTSGETMNPCDSFVCEGTGKTIGEFVMGSTGAMSWAHLDIYHALMSATYMLARGKKYSPGVGGASRFYTLRHDGTTNEYDWWYAKQYEDALEDFDSAFASLVFGVMDKHIDEPTFDQIAQDTVKQLVQMKRELKPGISIDHILDHLSQSFEPSP